MIIERKVPALWHADESGFREFEEFSFRWEGPGPDLELSQKALRGLRLQNWILVSIGCRGLLHHSKTRRLLHQRETTT